MRKRLIVDLLVISIIIAFAFWLILIFKLNFLTQAVLLFLVPSIYLILRKPKNLKRAAAGTILIGIFFYFFLLLIGNYNNSWFIPDQALIFPYKILGVIQLDYMIWGILWTMMIIIFYEHFLERERRTTLSKNFYWSLCAIVMADMFLVTVFLINPEFLKIPYAYAVTCLLSLVPVVYAFYKKRKLVFKIMEVIPFFALVFFIYEIVGLAISGWSYGGQYVGIVSVSNLYFPLEEVIFWFITSSLVVLTDYELYVDDEK
jgi:hypothetical protein